AQPARGQSEDVLRLRDPRQARRRFTRGVACLFQLGHVEEGDGEVDAGQGQIRRELERLPEGGGGVVVPELLEEGHADVVRAIGGLDGGRRRRGGERR